MPDSKAAHLNGKTADAPASPTLKTRAIHARGTMAGLILGREWASTGLGSMDTWSETLVSCVNQVLCSPQPTILAWGEELTMFYNDAVIPTLGDKHPEALGQGYREVFADAWPLVQGQMDNCLYNGETFVQENVSIPLLRDGHLRNDYFTYSFVPIYLSGGIAGVYNAYQDTTAAVLGALELKAVEAQASRVLESIGDAVIVADLDACIVRMNAVAETLTGWSEGDAKGQALASVFRVVNEGDHALTENPAAKVLRTGHIVGLSDQTLLLAKDGRQIAIDDQGSPIRNEEGELTGVVLVFRDAEERRALEQQREEALKQSRETSERLKFTIQSAGLGMWTYDPASGLVIADEEMCRIFGTKGIEQLAESWLDMVHADDRERVAAHFTGALAGNHAYDVDYRILRNGEVRWVRSRGKIVGPSGRMFAIVEDVSDRKQAEAALQQTEKLAAVGRLASSISHEINNPLEAMTNLLFLAKASQTLTEAQDYVETAERELRRVSLIANQTLRFHKQSTKPIPSFCYDLIGDSLSIYQARLINNHIEVEKRKRAEHPVKCFDGEIRQVLSNLIGNAIDAMPTGGRLLVRSREAKDWATGVSGIVLTVADTGTGMSQQVRRKIFDAFYTTKGIGGTGLGLWVSCEIVERHRGKISVRSSQTAGKSGTVFTLFLPFEAVERA